MADSIVQDNYNGRSLIDKFYQDKGADTIAAKIGVLETELGVQRSSWENSLIPGVYLSLLEEECFSCSCYSIGNNT